MVVTKVFRLRALRRRRRRSLCGRRVSSAGGHGVVVVRADGLAVWPVHHEATAYGRARLIDPAIHVCAVQGDTPSILSVFHDVQALGRIGGQVAWNPVLRLQYDRETAADGFARGTFCAAFGRAGLISHGEWASCCRVSCGRLRSYGGVSRPSMGVAAGAQAKRCCANGWLAMHHMSCSSRYPKTGLAPASDEQSGSARFTQRISAPCVPKTAADDWAPRRNGRPRA